MSQILAHNRFKVASFKRHESAQPQKNVFSSHRNCWKRDTDAFRTTLCTSVFHGSAVLFTFKDPLLHTPYIACATCCTPFSYSLLPVRFPQPFTYRHNKTAGLGFELAGNNGSVALPRDFGVNTPYAICFPRKTNHFATLPIPSSNLSQVTGAAPLEPAGPNHILVTRPGQLHLSSARTSVTRRGRKNHIIVHTTSAVKSVPGYECGPSEEPHVELRSISCGSERDPIQPRPTDPLIKRASESFLMEKKSRHHTFHWEEQCDE